jgi:hypothetical protein
MNKYYVVALAVLAVVAISAEGLCAGKARSGSAHKTRLWSSRGGGTFTGAVVWADPGTKTLTVKGRGRIVTFDATNPTFRGFKSLEDVREGSYVAVSYTSTGVRIAKTSKIESSVEEPREKSVAAKGTTARGAKKEPKKRIARVQQKGIGFGDVDENKDGKVTPVELSVVMGDLTMEKFKQYDKNGDGCLSETEYRSALRNR